MNNLNFSCTPEEAKDPEYLENRIRQELGISKNQQLRYRWRKRSIDARNRHIKVNASFETWVDEEESPRFESYQFPSVKDAEEIHIIGAGPEVFGSFFHRKGVAVLAFHRVPHPGSRQFPRGSGGH